ncbi:phosphoribosyltransferase [Sulfurimonas sp.]|uniref:phosphoribosyltransferase n=1 Tax=Sulfurimonas sp. TaxID=2022749 RepID=UPI003564CEFD
MKYYGYENFREDTKKLIKQATDFKPDAIVAIARGGLTIAHCMAEGLDIREVHSLRTELYDDTQKRDSISVYNNCEFFESVKRVIVVDDISDSGDTLDAVMKELKSKNSNIEFKSATLFYKKTSIYKPDFWVNEANEWIEFFWEKDFKD